MRTKITLGLLWTICAVLWVFVAADNTGRADTVLAVATDTTTFIDAALPDTIILGGAAAQVKRAAQLRDSCIDVNSASVATLIKLPGIGPVLAERIVTYREANGPYTEAAELCSVKGIGPQKVIKMQKRLCF